jgi:hypothetical protein
MKQQEGIGKPFVPMRWGPDGLLFDLQGKMLNIAPVFTKYLSLVNLSVRKINLTSAEKCMVPAVACTGAVAKLTGARRLASFPTRSKGQALGKKF